MEQGEILRVQRKAIPAPAKGADPAELKEVQDILSSTNDKLSAANEESAVLKQKLDSRFFTLFFTSRGARVIATSSFYWAFI